MFRFFKLSIFLIIALGLDLLIYSFTNTCTACTSFSQFLTTPVSLAGPSLTLLISNFSLTKRKK